MVTKPKLTCEYAIRPELPWDGDCPPTAPLAVPNDRNLVVYRDVKVYAVGNALVPDDAPLPPGATFLRSYGDAPTWGYQVQLSTREATMPGRATSDLDPSWLAYLGAAVMHSGGQGRKLVLGAGDILAWSGAFGSPVYHANGRLAWSGVAGTPCHAPDGTVTRASCSSVEVEVGPPSRGRGWYCESIPAAVDQACWAKPTADDRKACVYDAAKVTDADPRLLLRVDGAQASLSVCGYSETVWAAMK